MANTPVAESSVYTEKVEIVLGPINGRIYIRPLQDGTPYSNDSIDDLVSRMHEIAVAEKAPLGIFAPGLSTGKKDFTSKELFKYASEEDVNHVILFKSRIVKDKDTGEKSIVDSPYVALLANNSEGSRPKVKVF